MLSKNKNNTIFTFFCINVIIVKHIQFDQLHFNIKKYCYLGHGNLQFYLHNKSSKLN